MAVSAGTSGLGMLAGPEGVNTLAQARTGFSPGFASFGRAILGSGEHTFNASMILIGDVTAGLFDGLAKLIENS